MCSLSFYSLKGTKIYFFATHPLIFNVKLLINDLLLLITPFIEGQISNYDQLARKAILINMQ